MSFDATIADIWEEQCNALMEMPEEDRLIGVQAEDLLAIIDEWRRSMIIWGENVG